MEMQVTYYEYWDERVIFYLTKMYAGQIKRGDSYEKLKKCIHVSILDFIHFPEDDTCYRTICLCDKKTGKKYTDLLEIQVLELPKICGAKKGDSETAVANEIIKWMRFLGGKKREEFRKMAETDEYLSEAYEELKKLSADDKKRFEYEARERAILDYNSHMEGAEKKGFKQGISQGITRGVSIGKNEKLKELIQKKLHKGKSVETIADELEEDVSVIRELIDSLEIR